MSVSVHYQCIVLFLFIIPAQTVYGELISLCALFVGVTALFVGVTALFVGVTHVQHVMRAYNFIDST